MHFLVLDVGLHYGRKASLPEEVLAYRPEELCSSLLGVPAVIQVFTRYVVGLFPSTNLSHEIFPIDAVNIQLLAELHSVFPNELKQKLSHIFRYIFGRSFFFSLLSNKILLNITLGNACIFVLVDILFGEGIETAFPFFTVDVGVWMCWAF